MNRAICVFLFLLFLGPAFADQRRIGKRHDLSWTLYNDLGNNLSNFYPSGNYPDFLSYRCFNIESTGALGTATLAPQTTL